MPPRTDEELLERWQNGDATSGQALFVRYSDSVERFFAHKAPSSVEDLMQETFLRCVASHTRIKDGQFLPYLLGIARNVLHEYFRKAYRRDDILDVDEVSVCDVRPGQVTLMDQRREYRLLVESLRSIPIDDQVILELHYWEHLKTDEIASVFGIPPGTVRGRLQRARAKLEEVIRRLAASQNEFDSTLARLDAWPKDPDPET